METLGQFLKREREHRDITIEDVAKHTKYHLSKVKALENDAHDELPAPPYVKGMLRSISNFLGLDVTDVLLRYQDTLNESKTASKEKEIGLPKIPFYKRRHFLTISATGAFVILAIVVFILFQESKKLEPIGEITVPDKKAEEVAEEGAPAKISYRVRLIASDNVWLKTQVDSDRPKQFYMHHGQAVDLEARKVIRFFVSEAKALQIVFNGAEVPNPKTGPRTFVFPKRR